MKLNRNQLKYLAIVAMFIDHVAWAFVPYTSAMGQIMHFIGRLTGPMMAYFLAQGYAHTRNVKKYALRLGIFALISWPAFSLFERGMWPLLDMCSFGVIYTLFLGLLAIWLWDKGRCPKWVKVLGIIALCFLSLLGDWPVFDVLWPLALYRHRDEPGKQVRDFCIGGAVNLLVSYSMPWWTMLNALGVFVVPLLLMKCYSGESGSKAAFHKWFFYGFYPLHLLALWVLKQYIS